jgi:hypothetical protein
MEVVHGADVFIEVKRMARAEVLEARENIIQYCRATATIIYIYLNKTIKK